MPSTGITINSCDGGRFGAYLAVPETPNGGGIVILQEIFGINANMRHTAEHFAAAGYYAIVPDLFWRQQPGVDLDPTNEMDRMQAAKLMSGLDIPLALEDALAAARHLQQQPHLDGKVGCVGYCLGGKLAYLLAACSEISCAVSYYGVAIQTSLENAENIACPTLLHIAENDHLCPPEAQSKIIDAMEPYQGLVKILTYPQVGHAFARSGSSVFNALAAERADTATHQILRKNLLV